jgi:hypothetical protein
MYKKWQRHDAMMLPPFKVDSLTTISCLLFQKEMCNLSKWKWFPM